FGYLSEQGAITRDAASGRYVVDYARMPQAIATLAKELLEMEATGDRARVEKWFQKYAVMPPELAAVLAKVSDVPVDIDPVFSFAEPIR
ncbi:MAG: Zn-dependent hydrolase, partial [Acidobacteria bacterium]|nr:Zn-dependent hydrolase [Acidobacteriota bacterium]